VRPLVVFAPALDPPDDDLELELLEDEPDFDEPAVFDVPVLRDDDVADFAPPRDEVDDFAPLLLLADAPLLEGELFDAEDFDVPLLLELPLLLADDEPPRDDAADLEPLAFDVPVFDDDDFAELLLPDEPLLAVEPLLPEDEEPLLPDELRPDEDVLLPDDELLRLPDEVLRDELPLALPRLVEPLAAPLPVETMSTAVDAAPTTAPVAAPPRRSVATSATLSMIVLTAESVVPLDFLEEFEAERFEELDDFPAIMILPMFEYLNLCSKSKLAHF
jgi:hypothetical protein